MRVLSHVFTRCAFVVSVAKISAMGTMGEELEGLRARAEEAKEVQAQLEAANEENVRLEELYHAEQVSGFGISFTVFFAYPKREASHCATTNA